MPEPLLDIHGLNISFSSEGEAVCIVNDVDLEIQRGEAVALVGESGSGKTVTALSIAGLLPASALATVTGQILLDGIDLNSLTETELQRIRGRRVAYIFQEPGSALNPVFTVHNQIAEALRLHGDGSDRNAKILSLLDDVGIDEPDRVAKSYPHQISGGQQQRVMIAIALACEPEILIADEPTTALDVTVQAQIIDLLIKLRDERDMSVLMITHNLAIAAKLAQRMYVMRYGEIVENGKAVDVIQNPEHEYTQTLLRAVPRLHGSKSMLEGIADS